MNPEFCQRCGHALPEDARFCPNCGAAVGLASAQERKVVTVVFVDIVGSTRWSATLDAERFRDVLSTFYETVSSALVAFGGRPANFVGDAVVGVFGIPVAHDDDAARGIRSGLAIVEEIQQAGEKLGLPEPLRVRVGVNTGPVAIGSNPAEEGIVIGSEVHLAARIQQAATPGEVLCGPTTWVLTRDVVEYGPERKIEAKGFEEAVTAWPAHALAPGATRRRIPMVDRQRELALLADTFERVVEGKRAHLVTLLGESGIGKSRVVEEFLTELPPGMSVLRGRSSSFEEDVTYAPIAQMLLGLLGEDPAAPAERLWQRLEETIRDLAATDEVEQVVGRVGLALGLGDESGEERRYRSGEVRAGFLSVLAGLASRGPVVLVFEDLHLASEALLETVEMMVKEARRIPVLVLGVARWDLIDQRPSWAGGLADAVTLWVEPLSLGHATQLAIEAGEGIDDEEAQRIARHAGGNPFFIVETIAVLREEDEHLPLARGSSARLLPATVQAVVAARFDHLQPEARDVVRKASIFARATFDLSELALIATPTDEIMRELEEGEILVRDEERPSAWRFRHDLLRDVAYESLAKRERQRLHLRLANKMSDPALFDRYPMTIAYHMEQAARNALDLNPRDRTLAERAIGSLMHAGDLARRRLESQSAVDLYERALAMAGPESSWGEREAWILSLRGEAQYWMGEFDAAEVSLRRALELDPDRVLIRAHASRYLADIALTVRGDGEVAAPLFQESLEASRELGDPQVLARTLLMAGWAPYWRNDLDQAREMFEEALAVARDNPQGDAWAEARALVGLSSITSPVGDERVALELAEQALEIGRTSGDAFTTAVARENVANSLRRMWRLDEAMKQAESAIRIFRELGARWELASGLGDRGLIRRLSGLLSEAEVDLREAYRLCKELNERALITWTASELARVLVAKGEIATARQVLDEPSVRLSAGDPGAVASVLEAECILALAEGDRDTASAKAAEALEVERAMPWPNPRAAQVWWTGVLFGPESVGGAEALEEARAVLESHNWIQALKDPELVPETS